MDEMQDHVFGRLDPSLHADGELGEYFNCQMTGRFQDHRGYSSEIGSDGRRHATEVDAYKGGDDKVSSEMYDLMKAQIANHPRYTKLVSAYLECRKVGAPPEVTTLLEEIEKERLHPICVSGEIGDDPELDDFMEAYCEVLSKYKVELSKPFDEARTFLSKIERQLSNLCKDTSSPSTNTYGGNEHSDDAVGSSEDEHSYGEVEEYEIQESNLYPADKELKEMLMKKYSGYLSSLKKEFLKRRKKGKLPKDARLALLNWWDTHYRWPYPTDEEKMKLGERTGLDQKQINNWFINQRKRHWKPSEDMRLALMEGVSGVHGGPPPLYFDCINDDSY